MPPKTAKRDRKCRPWYYFEDPQFPRPDEKEECSTRLDDGTVSIDPIVFYEGDLSLRQFPQNLRTDLEAYLQTPGATTKTFASHEKQFNLYKSGKDESVCFMEMDTMNKLDCATFRCGPVAYRGQMVVARPALGSTFNNGQAAIIVYYGKGHKSLGHKLASRWAIWTPTGFKKDIIVDRMIMEPISDPSHDNEGGVTSSTRQKRKYSRRVTSLSQNTDGESDEDTDVNDDDFLPGSNASLYKRPRKMFSQQPQRASRRSGIRYNYEDDSKGENTFDSDYGDDLGDIEARRHIFVDANSRSSEHSLSSGAVLKERVEDTKSNVNVTNSAGDGNGANFGFTPQSSPRGIAYQIMSAKQGGHITPCYRTAVQAPIAQNNPVHQRHVPATPTTDPPSTLRSATPRSFKSTTAKTVFIFKASHDEEATLSKSTTQCNSVQKLFAYGMKAGISNAETTMLSAHTKAGVVNVVRDDNEDFEELLSSIERERKTVGDEFELTIVVVPGTF